MAEDHALPLRVSEIKDPAVLFECYNTEQIRRVERKVRGEIEQKKEELRQMVGERYRDLIDAADTIGEMRQCSESVVQSIQDMHQYCLRLKQGKNSVGSSKQEVNALPNYTCYRVKPWNECRHLRNTNLPFKILRFLTTLKIYPHIRKKIAVYHTNCELPHIFDNSALKNCCKIIGQRHIDFQDCILTPLWKHSAVHGAKCFASGSLTWQISNKSPNSKYNSRVLLQGNKGTYIGLHIP